MRSRAGASGFTLAELLLTIAVLGTIVGIAIPIVSDTVDSLRTAAAARYISGRVTNSRFEAIRRTADVALRFVADVPDYTFTSYMDGNGDGVRTADIRAGIDKPLTTPERLPNNFKDVRFGLIAGLPDADGLRTDSTDGVRIGTSRILTLSPNGTATSGTLYIRGRRAQYAVRVFGMTARTRVLQYDTGQKRWVSR
jgi:prepilin-type N-terminal cleavage/methylation domain-containing protein